MFSSFGPRGDALVATDSAIPVHWKTKTIVLHPVISNEGESETGAALHAAAVSAAETWNRALSECTAPRMLLGPLEVSDRQAVRDGSNLLVLRTTDWCPPHARDAESCYSPERSGITHLHTQDGRLLEGDGILAEADVEIDGVHLSWTSATGRQELEALLLHELGHVLGLDHSCSFDSPCSADAARDSVMYPAPLEEGRPRMLQPDELSLDALCSLYGVQKSSFLGFGVEGRSWALVLLGVLACAAFLLARFRRGARAE